MIVLSFLVHYVIIGSVFSLRMEDADEGSCHTRSQSVPLKDLSFLDRLTYIPAGNRLNFYVIASGHPRFEQMMDSELVNSMCLTHNVPLSQPVATGSTFGFGGLLGNFTARQMKNQPGVFYASTAQGMSTKIQSITLTDYETFAFVDICWATDAEYKSWQVYSLTPQLSRSTRRMIEDHAISLGFNRQEFMFLDYSSCERETDQDFRGGWSSPPANKRFQRHQ